MAIIRLLAGFAFVVFNIFVSWAVFMFALPGTEYNQ